jgi:16S rRNA (guanine527-N7)-methyltransferase
MEALRKTIEEGLAHFGIDYDDERLSHICDYVEILEKWNRRMNLIGLRETKAVVQQLIYDAFFLFTRTEGRGRILDLGSGAGILAIPTAILAPGRTLFSVDKSLRKVQFQRHVKRVLGLPNLLVFHERIEDLEPLDVDALMAKAFGSAHDVLTKGRRHVVEGGAIFLVRGKSEKPSEEKGFILIEERGYRLPGSDKEYQLFVYKKVP